MPNESSTDVKLEIGHVLFIDIVGYSQLLITEQSEQIDLRRIKTDALLGPAPRRSALQEDRRLARAEKKK